MKQKKWVITIVIIGVIVAIGAAFILALVLDLRHDKAENEKLGRLRVGG